MTFKFRYHKGSLVESLETVITLSSKHELLEEVIVFYGDMLPAGTVTMDKLIITEYGFDKRIGWGTYIVIVRGVGPVGFTDGPVQND